MKNLNRYKNWFWLKKLIFILVFLFQGTIFAQNSRDFEIGIPLVKNYLPKDYKAFSQNWGFVQDKRGVLYFANGDGVLMFDGVHWDVVKITNNYTVSSIAIDRFSRIFVGSTSEFGYISTTKTGKFKYTSLISYFDEKDRKFDYILNIYVLRDAVYFMTSEKMFRWSDGKMHHWNLHKPANCIKFDNSIFVWQKNSGLKYLHNDSLVHFNGSDYFFNIPVFNILPYENRKMLIVTRDSGLYLMNNPFRAKDIKSPDITYFYTEINNFIKDNQLLYSCRLSNGNYAFATLRAGTAIVSPTGKLIQLLNKKTGIFNETHNYVSQDNQSDVWLAMDNGIAKADIASPLSFWNDEMGLRGSVMSVARMNNILYTGTWQGVYCLKRSADKDVIEDNIYSSVSRFVPLKEINYQTWDLALIKNKINPLKNILIAATSGGIYYISSNNKVTFIEKGTGLKILTYNSDPTKIFIGLTDGILCLSLKYTGDEISVVSEGRIKDFDEKIISLTEDEKGRIWITTEFNGVFLLEFPKLKNKTIAVPLNSESSTKIIRFDTTSGLPSSYVNSYKINNKIVFISTEGIYFPQEIQKNNNSKEIHFVKQSNFVVNLLCKYMNINNLKEDESNNIWIQLSHKETNRKVTMLAKLQKDNTYSLITIPFKPIPQMEMYAIYPENDKIAWFGGDDGLVRYDGNINFEYKKEYYALIRKVIINNDSLIFGGNFYASVNDSSECEGLSVEQPEEMKPEISFSYNSLTFEYAAPSFYEESSNLYKTYLEGFNKNWSDWTNETKKEFTNLPIGKYVFHVKAKNVFDNESIETTYGFEIRPPWYRTWIAYIIYFIIFCYLIYTVVKYSNKRLREAKLNLEDVVKERTNEIILQKKLIEKEKEQSEKLLLNILPFKIAEELKANGHAKTKSFEMVSVMFSDFKDFTIIAQKIEPQQLIDHLNKCFMFFDDVCVRHNIEKIKTIGDSYMCAGGIPIRNKTNPVDIILAAFEMRDYINKEKKDQAEKGLMLWKIRIGINTGPIISGVVGKKKFAYDIWGDTVNTASRMEQASMPNKINISGETYELTKDFFDFTYRGQLPVKHKGDTDMYFVDRIKKELSVDEEGSIPNQHFWELYETLNTPL
jgi:class 3 adenylate cyclase